MFDSIGYQWTDLPGPYIDKWKGPINRTSNKKKPWNGKLIRKLLLTMTVADPKRFTPKSKPITYTGAFIELYIWRNVGQVHEIYKMIELKKIRAWTKENLCNLGAHPIIEILSVLHSAHLVLSN